VASQFLIKDKSLKSQIVIIDPAEFHYYQPAWTLVGSGVFDIQKTQRKQSEVIPKGVHWIQQKVSTFQPNVNLVTLENGDEISYQYLIVAAGIQLNWNEIKGLNETLGKNSVCSNYSFEHASYTYECIRNLKHGKALFHNPHTPVKCGGAPHKIMYMAADYFRKNHVLNNIEIQYWSGAGKLFAVPKYEKTLLGVCERADIKLNFMVKLVEIDGPNKKAKFVGIGENNKDHEYEETFDMIHVTPPQSAPDFIKNSSLANAAGWVDVDKNSLQHVRFPNVFSLGDSSGLPTSKTGAAIRKQAPVLVANVLSAMKGQSLNAEYNGYTSCPLVTGYGKLVLAEFDYEGNPQETFPFDQSKERWSMYMLKRYVLPWLYWTKILTGKA
jgi:sulfide:quinone oxidoreductase